VLVAAHEPAELPVGERYLVTLMDVEQLDELETEISWPITPGSATDQPIDPGASMTPSTTSTTATSTPDARAIASAQAFPSCTAAPPPCGW
jgi:hypothetical protein